MNMTSVCLQEDSGDTFKYKMKTEVFRLQDTVSERPKPYCIMYV